MGPKEATPLRVKRDEEDVRKLVGCFTSGLMTHPFSLEMQPILNLATGAVLPDDVADALLASHSKGKEQMMMLLEKRLNTSTVSLCDAIPRLRINTFSSTTKKVNVESIR